MKKQQFKSGVWAKLLKTSKDFFKPGDIVLAAVSGGADSVCLLHFLNFLSGRDRFKLYACHVGHGLRKTASRDEKFTKDLCKKYGVKCFTVKADVRKLAKEKSLSTEHAARKARYDAFEKTGKKIKADYVALAHHADDNAETVLLNLLRSASGVLRGIPRRRALNKNIEIIRPFLEITKKDIMNYAKFNNLDFVEDETNKDNDYTRNWIRNELLPLLATKQPRIREHLTAITKGIKNA